SLREAIATREPSDANARAHARPMPLLPPVISTTFPSNPSFMPFPPAGAECSIISHVARITLGLGTSHGPMLSVAPEIWPERVNADRVNPQHFYKAKTYRFDELVGLRKQHRSHAGGVSGD